MQRCCVLALALTIGPLAGSARADMIRFQGIGHASTVSIGGVRTGTFWAGELNWNWVTPDPAGQPHDFYTYCVDIAHNLTNPQTVNLASTNGLFTTTPDGGKKAAWLFNQYAAGIRSNPNDAVADILAAALQVSIWEAMLDPTMNLSSGLFRLTSNGAVKTQALVYLGALYSGPGGYNTSEAQWLDVPGNVPGQDQITTLPPQVPEPSILAVLATGVAGFCAFRRKRLLAPGPTRH
jgi:hypothetical protein